MRYWVYILHCDNDTYYTGYTHDLKKRYQSHINGTGRCKYTKSFKPLYMAACWEISGEKSSAMRLEREIKRFSRQQKEATIKNPEILSSSGIKCVSMEALEKLLSS